MPGPVGRRRPVAVLGCLALAAVLTGTGGTARAAGPPQAREATTRDAANRDTTTRDTTTRDTTTRDTTTAKARDRRSAQVRAYWTPARMAAAVPGEQLVRAASPDRVTRRPGLSAYLTRLAAARAAAPATDRGSTWRHGGLAARTTGKVFFSLGGGDYVCSGSAVSSPDRSTVLTAGHCVHDPDVGAYATRWVFVPGYARDARPYGMFPAAHLAAPAGWRTGRDYDVDLAFVDVDPNEAGRLLTDVVGGQPVAFATPRGRAVQALGYPAQDPWDGELLIGCSGPVRQDPRARASTDQGLACTMTGGSSGGPWLSDFDPVTGRGTLTSVTSFGYTDEPGVLWGPYLGSVAKALYTSVASTRSR